MFYIHLHFSFSSFSDDNIFLLTCKCNRTFRQNGHLRYHQKWECGRNLLCQICQKQFNTVSNLNRHERTCSKKKLQETNNFKDYVSLSPTTVHYSSSNPYFVYDK